MRGVLFPLDPGPLAIHLIVVATLSSVPSASAQEEGSSSPSIELGSSRIGGPGLSDRERRIVKSWDEPEEYVTEETLPDKGNKKRLPSLHVLAERYYGGQQWKDTCRFYEMILEEAAEEGLAAREGAQKKAARSFYECARIASSSGDFEGVETYLGKAEKLGLKSARHDVLRRRVVREQFRSKVATGDMEGAHRLLDKYQSMGEADDDERIWFGEQLAAEAKRALSQKDNITFREMMDKLEVVAPLNTDYRAMKADLSADASLFRNIALVLGVAVGAVVLLSLLSTWRSRARLGATKSKNPFLDDDDDI